MKRVIVMRHAKSDWDAGAPSDHARPLNRRGRKDAPRVARRLAEMGWRPDHVLSSDAQRTTETYELMAPEFEPAASAEFLADLYHAGPVDLEGPLSRLSDQQDTVLVLGHNPGWERVVYWLTQESVELTTANAVLIECDTPTWSEVVGKAGVWEMIELIRPRQLDANPQ